MTLATSTLLQMVVPDAPQNLIGDNAYDSDHLDAELKFYGIEVIAPRRRTRKNSTQALIDRTRGPLNLNPIKTIFGDKSRPHYDKRKKNPTRWGVVVEKPAYDVTIFKVHYGKMTLKIYTKGEHVLRIEVIVHNTKEYRWGRSLPCFPQIVLRLRGILERFLNAAGCVDACFVSDDNMENLPQPAQAGQTKVGGIDLNKPRMRRVANAVLALASSPTGFTASGLAQKVRAMNGESDSALWYPSRYLWHQETPSQGNGTEDRSLATLRISPGGSTSPDCSGGSARTRNPPSPRRQHSPQD